MGGTDNLLPAFAFRTGRQAASATRPVCEIGEEIIGKVAPAALPWENFSPSPLGDLVAPQELFAADVQMRCDFAISCKLAESNPAGRILAIPLSSAPFCSRTKLRQSP